MSVVVKLRYLMEKCATSQSEQIYTTFSRLASMASHLSWFFMDKIFSHLGLSPSCTQNNTTN